MKDKHVLCTPRAWKLAGLALAPLALALLAARFLVPAISRVPE